MMPAAKMPASNGESRKTVQYGLLILGIATLVQAGILSYSEQLFFPYALFGTAIYYGLLGALAVPVWRVCALVRERSYRLLPATAIHVLLGLAVLVVWQGAYFGILYLSLGGLPDMHLRETGLWQALGAVMIYAAMVAGMITVQTSRSLARQMRRQAELEILAREAEIRALKLLIRPHFFFNVMNSIYSLIETRPRQAQAMVELVADLMRQTLDASEENLVSLEWELRAVETYLRIEKVRLGDRLSFHLDSQDVASDWAVPPFLLQPLVENAIKHGVAPHPGPGQVDVVVRMLASELELAVRDSGPGCPQPVVGEENEGRGLSITRRRLENLYEGQFSILQRNLEPRGFEVAIRIPQQKLASAPALSHV